MDKNNVKTLLDLITQSAAEFGDKTFVKEKAGKEVSEKSFNSFYNDSMRVAEFLKEATNGEKVHAAVIGLTSYNYLVSYFGTVSGGNVAVPLDAQLSCEDIADHINRADVTVFFYDARYAPMIPAIKKLSPQVKTYVAMQDNEDADNNLSEILAKYEPKTQTPVEADSLAAIVYTSGTTGLSKGVMLTHGNLIDNAMCQDNESSTEDVLLTVLPVHHVYCFTCDILCSIRYGATLCVNDSLMRIAQNLQLFKPTLMLLVPMIAQTICKQINAAAKAKKLPAAAVAQAFFGGRLKGIFSGGAYLAPEVVAEYKSFGIPISQGYGMTECSPRISTATLDVENIGDVGMIVNGCTVKIVDGEITVKSPSVMQGYYKNPEATAEALTEDGWLRTGDLGYVDDENRVFITGRKKNLIILSNGENVSPEELENKFAVVELVAEIMVYGEDGFVTAEIFPNADLTKDMTREDVVAALNEEIKKVNDTLSSSKTIRRLRLRETEFDKTPSKKIKRTMQTSKGELV
ncbi:MAG: AMP-binding protein [Oscillospiraceae bacterium]|nr:AMP-binding protein [Oscillospiraceae bacterium]